MVLSVIANGTVVIAYYKRGLLSVENCAGKSAVESRLWLRALQGQRGSVDSDRPVCIRCRAADQTVATRGMLFCHGALPCPL